MPGTAHSTETRRLPEPLPQFAADFLLSDGQLRMPMDKLRTWSGQLLGPGVQNLSAIVTGILALATRFQREGGSAAEEATAQCCALAAVLMTHQGVQLGEGARDALLNNQGLQKKTEKILGELTSNARAPLEGERPSGAAGMLRFLEKK